ncbi:SAM-dependent methyltransferase, partial [Burkholderia cenocepacia]|nr:SAM-dependent methyltransferase [Burkholderia cenocepacia]
MARARAQFQGPNEAFPTLVDEYEALAPRLRGRFLETFGLFTEDFESSAGSALSLAVSAETGRFLREHHVAQEPSR